MLEELDRLRAAWTLFASPNVVERAYHVQVVVTERCNFACAGCLKSDPENRPSNRDMPLERFERILAGLRPRLVTLLGEGDPLLHGQVVDLVRAPTCLSDGLSVTFCP